LPRAWQRLPNRLPRLKIKRRRNAQQALKDKGLYPGPIDGAINAQTKKALRDFQKQNNLKVSGTLNHETMAALGVTSQKSTTTTTKPGAPGSTSPSKDKSAPGKPTSSIPSQSPSTREALGVSSQGTISNVEDVRQVQQSLVDLMYDPGDINGLMTAKTRQAIREFQFLNNLPVTGNIDHQTKIAIDSQWKGGVETAKSKKTSYSSSLVREKPTITTEEQTQTRTHKYDKSDHKESSDRVTKAAAVLEDLTSADKRIPNELLERAEAIAVIPNMIKGAFGIGGRYGKGVVSQRLENGRWSPPAFVDIGGGSFGAQLGVSSTDLALVFTDRKALNMLEGGKDLKLGVDAAAVAGPIGRSAEAGVNLKLESAIYSYSRSKGLFVGVALDGAVLSINDSRNAKVYGSSVSAKDILNGNVPVNPTVRPFMNALEKITPKKKISQK
jgi:lipid-binding SYLF domain-containing protein